MAADAGDGLRRRDVVAALLREPDAPLVVTGLGTPTWDCAAAGDRSLNFYLWGAMGSAAMVGLGLALAQPERRVLVITGDGEMLMGLGGLATIAAQRPPNLALVVLDNECHGETGGQPTHTAYGVDLAGVAAACGFAVTRVVRDRAALDVALPLAREAPGPVLLAVKVSAEPDARVIPARDGAYLKDRFREALLGQGAVA